MTLLEVYVRDANTTATALEDKAADLKVAVSHNASDLKAATCSLQCQLDNITRLTSDLQLTTRGVENRVDMMEHTTTRVLQSSFHHELSESSFCIPVHVSSASHIRSIIDCASRCRTSPGCRCRAHGVDPRENIIGSSSIA